MIHTYLESNNIISSLGLRSGDTLDGMLAGESGIAICRDRGLSGKDFPVSLVDWEQVDGKLADQASPDDYTRFEKIVLLSVQDALSRSQIDPADAGTALILSTTKGNVELLGGSGGFGRDRLSLWGSADLIAAFFGIKNRPLVISNACISGVVSMLMAHRLIRSGKFDHVVVVGADVVSRFIVSGFQSFLSLSDQPCRPFDELRDGLTLGEAAATVIISRQHGDMELTGGAITNDANHISGPSRTGEGLLLAIRQTLGSRKDVDLISGHGTATVYNDEMESIAIGRAGLEKVPVNSLKGYVGHTLGAAGIVESVVNLEAMKQGLMVPTMGYSNRGVSGNINVVKQPVQKEVATMLKVASGFGGCNAAALFERRV